MPLEFESDVVTDSSVNDVRLVSEHTLAHCSDGIDNDNKGFADCADHGCTNAADGATPEAIAFCNGQ